MVSKIEIYSKKKFNPSGKQNKKKQIILTHTSRPIDLYISKLENIYLEIANK